MSQEKRHLLADTCRRMYAAGLVAAYGGNASAWAGSAVLITPSGTAMDEVEPEALLLVDERGRVLEGDGEPSSELRLHLAIYEAVPGAGGIVHCHPPAATAFASLGEGIRAVSLEGEKILGHIPIAPPLPHASAELAEAVARLARDSRVVLLPAHGLVARGDTVAQALRWAELAEEMARVALYREVLELCRKGVARP
mgnify:CR=1 FL=1